jgi:Amt family ammonium transporter
MRCFFLLTFAAAIPAIISGGIAERAKMRSQAIATLILVALIYPFFEGMIWNGNYGFQKWLKALLVQLSMTLQVQWLYMRWVDGLH